MAVMNAELLKKEMITHIVNTAKGLEYFGPRYLVRIYVPGVGLDSLVPRLYFPAFLSLGTRLG